MILRDKITLMRHHFFLMQYIVQYSAEWQKSAHLFKVYK